MGKFPAVCAATKKKIHLIVSQAISSFVVCIFNKTSGHLQLDFFNNQTGILSEHMFS